MALSDGLTGELGPLPVWGWVAIGGVGLYLYKKHQGATASGGTGLLGGLIGGGADATSAAGTNSSAGVPSGQDWTSSNTASGVAPLTDNTAWGAAAVKALESAGYDGLQAATAIQTYLGGGTMDPSMATLISTAIKDVGTPPEGLLGLGVPAPVMNTPVTPPVTSTTGPAPTSNSAPVKYTTYTVKRGDTQAAIAKRYGTTIHDLQEANPAIDAKGSKVKVGEKLKVPTH